jgi:flagellar protein FliS
MNASYYAQQYRRQAVQNASPTMLTLKLYDAGVRAARSGDRDKLRAVLVELIGSLNHEQGGDLAGRLYALYSFCLTTMGHGDLEDIADILDGLRESWREAFTSRRMAA